MNRALAIGIVLLLCLLTAFLWARPEQLPPDPLPEIDLPVPISVMRVVRAEPLSEKEAAEGERILRLFWREWSAERARQEVEVAMGGRDCQVYSPGYLEFRPYQPELGLWVRGYPSVAFAWARRALAKVDYTSENVVWAFRAMIELAAVGYPGAASALVRACREADDPRLYPQALLYSDLHSRHTDLLKRWAAEGVGESWEVLTYLEECVYLLHIKDVPSYGARIALQRAEAFRRGGWEEFARRAILSGEGQWAGQHFEWALRVARERGAPWLEAAIRERLAADHPQGRAIQAPMGDEVFDLGLLTLAEIGAELSAPERAYLRHYGFGCDPRLRLAEVLREKGY